MRTRLTSHLLAMHEAACALATPRNDTTLWRSGYNDFWERRMDATLVYLHPFLGSGAPGCEELQSCKSSLALERCIVN